MFDQHLPHNEKFKYNLMFCFELQLLNQMWPHIHIKQHSVYSGVLFYLPENALAWKTGAAQSQFFPCPQI